MSILTTSPNFIGLRMFYTCLWNQETKCNQDGIFFKLLKKKVVSRDNCERVDEHTQAIETGTKRSVENKKGRRTQNKTANQ